MNFGRYLSLVYILFGMILNWSFASTLDGHNGRLLLPGESPVKERQLQAAVRDVDLARRNFDVSLQHELQMHYLEEFDPKSANSGLVAGVTIASKLPSLLLENIEHLLDEIQCELESIRLVFKDNQYMETVRQAIVPQTEFMLVTSHFGCNFEDSRLPWIISEYTFSDESSSVTFSALAIPWKDTFHSMQVDFRQNENGYSRRSNLHRGYHRDKVPFLAVRVPSTAVASTSIAALSSIIAPSTTTGTPTLTSISFPIPDSTETAVATMMTNDIGRQLINYPILPSNNSVLADVEGQILPAGLKVQCTNCTTRGTIELLSGSFNMNVSSNNTDLVHFIQDGYVQFIANDLLVHVALETTWQAGIDHTFTANIASIPLQPFSIPDLAVVGPLFNPRLVLGADLINDLDFSYGFEIAVPNNSSIIATIGNVTQSQVTGFQNTSFTLLPFQSTVPSLALNLTATLQPELLIGISFFDGLGNAGFGAFLTLPQLAVQIAQVSGTDDKCQPLSNSSTVNGVLDSLGNLTHVIPQVALGAGLIAQATLGAGFEALQVQTSYAPFATAFAAPTACLEFDKKGSSYVAAAATPTTSSSAGAGGKQKGGAEGVRNPFVVDGGWGRGRLQVTLVVLAMVFGVFMVL